MFRQLGNLALYAYDALNPGGKRKQPAARVEREDNNVRGTRRIQLMSNAADLKRNLSVAAWMVRRHLDYVANFSFQPETGDRGFDLVLLELMRWQSEREQMDRGRRMSREKYFRLCEARRVLDGDCGSVRLRSGQLQFIKGDLIADPPEARNGRENDRREWESGIQIDRGGAPIQFSIWQRGRGGQGREHSRNIAAARFYHYGFFADCASDQVRGISPFTEAMTDLRDFYETKDYIKLKIKLAQLLGVKFTRTADSDALTGNVLDSTSNSEEGEDDSEDTIAEREPIDWSKGITTFDLDEGEDVDLIESGTPATETQSFLVTQILVALKSLDIPYSFFDEKHTNFHGSRGGWLQYMRSADDKRRDQIEFRNQWTLWQLQRWILDGLLVLPQSIPTIRDVRFRWVPKGMPWWKPSEEVKASIEAIGSGLSNPVLACNEADRGDVFANIDRTLEVIRYAQERGIAEIGRPLVMGFDLGLNTTGSEQNTEPDTDPKDEDELDDDELEDDSQKNEG